MRKFELACAIALAGPLGAVAVLLVIVAAGERIGATPFSGVTPLNSAEAAGMASAVHVLRFLGMGEDPNRVYPIRPQIISSAVRRATTVEAAMWSRQLGLIQLLDRQGAIVGADRRRALACLAVDLRVEDAADYLAPEGTAFCEPGKAFEAVLARTSPSGEGAGR
ncbi:MAG TPA: hypothetical protein VIX63_11890 [Vicinamibacterales bacterium]